MTPGEATGTAPQNGRRPTIAFLGTGWIGLNRMENIVAEGNCDVVAVADPSAEMVAKARELAPDAAVAEDLDELLALKPDGVIIATPSALHARQAITALEHGAAVFCQKPLGRTKEEVRDVVSAARAADRLLGVDLSYRFTEGMAKIREQVLTGKIGDIFAADLTFHNAYGPDKPWFYDKALSGGGCVIDLGVHLVDLALWILDFPPVQHVEAALYREGRLLGPGSDEVEDYAVATIRFANGATVRLACSWHLHAGRDAVIEARFHGTNGGAALCNVAGSFYDFEAELYQATSRTVVASPPDDWGGQAARDWARRLAAGDRFSPESSQHEIVAEVLDRIYGRRMETRSGLAAG